MNDLTLYEEIPKSSFPIRLLDWKFGPYKFALHWHEHIELHYIFKGTARIRCADEILTVSEGQCVIINGNELHQGVGGTCSYGCMILPPEFFDNTRAVFERVITDSFISEMFQNIYTSLRSDKIESGFEIKGYTNLLAARIMSRYSKELLTENIYAARIQKLDKINNAVQYINEHFSGKITTTDLARLTHLSEGHFCSVFKEATGMTSKEYINSVRIKNAENLLLSTDMSIADAAMYSGFPDANYFTKMFKKANGITPCRFRKQK